MALELKERLWLHHGRRQQVRETHQDAARWRRRCRVTFRVLRARLLDRCTVGRRQRDRVGKLFDLAAGLGPERLDWFVTCCQEHCRQADVALPADMAEILRSLG